VVFDNRNLRYGSVSNNPSLHTALYQNQLLRCSVSEVRDAGPAVSSSATATKSSLIISGFSKLLKAIIRTAMFWVIKQTIAVIPYQHFETICRSHIQSLSQESWPLKMGPIGCPETSAMNYRCSLCNDPKERSSHLLRGGSLKSRRVIISFVVYVCLCVRLEQSRSQSTDFHEILYLRIFRKYVPGKFWNVVLEKDE
jgi:hypothetical protein